MTENLENKDSDPYDYLDPSWDYVAIFKMLVQLQHEVGKVMAFTASQEVATVESHCNLGMRLECLSTSLRSIQEKLK